MPVYTLSNLFRCAFRSIYFLLAPTQVLRSVECQTCRCQPKLNKASTGRVEMPVGKINPGPASLLPQPLFHYGEQLLLANPVSQLSGFGYSARLGRGSILFALWFDLLITEPMGRKEEFVKVAWGFGRNKVARERM